MNIYDQYPSKYIKASDLQGRRVKEKVGNIVQEILGNDTKMIIYFAGKEKGIENLFYREDFRRATMEETGEIVFPHRMLEF